MTIRFIVIAFSCFLSFQSSNGQDYFWVSFTNKAGASFSLEEYFPANVLEKRIRQNIPLIDSSDFPVSPDYLLQVAEFADTIYGASRWLNSVLIRAQVNQIQAIQSLSFVKNIRSCGKMDRQYTNIESELPTKQEEIRRNQVESLGLDYFKADRLSGKGIRIAVFDGGFPGIDQHEGLKFLVDKGQILETWNFPAGDKNVIRNNPHGTAVLSCIAGSVEGRPTGLAPDADFLLARTELAGEPWREQLYWIQAAEWADKHGAQIICSALGYTSDHYFPEEMDGSSPVAEAARIAFSKGMLIVNSIGNDGENSWKYLGTPADAMEVLAVGAADPNTQIKMNYSSFGPNSNGQIKPNVLAAGQVLAATTSSWKVMFGTSFSAPLIAGYAACLWQKFPHLSNKQLFQLIEQTGRLYPYYDYAHGFGIPDPNRITNLQRAVSEKELITEFNEHRLLVRTPSEEYGQKNPLLYYHIANLDGHILEYKVLEYKPGQNIEIDLSSFSRPKIIRIRIPGYFTKVLYGNDNE